MNVLKNDCTPVTNLSRIGSESLIKKISLNIIIFFNKEKSKPPGTLEYQVEIDDTIEKIALKWDTVPSEIQHLNRLVTRVIFPGNKIIKIFIKIVLILLKI